MGKADPTVAGFLDHLRRGGATEREAAEMIAGLHRKIDRVIEILDGADSLTAARAAVREELADVV